ncbi:MAG TPA: hypothetical protein VJJ22_00810 [Candidatus Paceibacterota bacterium]
MPQYQALNQNAITREELIPIVENLLNRTKRPEVVADGLEPYLRYEKDAQILLAVLRQSPTVHTSVETCLQNLRKWINIS